MLASFRAAFGAGTEVQSSGPLCAVRIGVSRMLSVLYLLLLAIVVPYEIEKERDKANLFSMVNGSPSEFGLVYQTELLPYYYIHEFIRYYYQLLDRKLTDILCDLIITSSKFFKIFT